MRRLQAGLGVVVLALTACNPVRDAFSAHPEVAGTAVGETLTVNRLAELVGEAKKVPLRPQVMTGLATVYLDYAVYAVALAHGRNLDDSALVLAANWPNVSQLRWQRFHDRLVAAHATLSPQQIDSAFQAGDVRLFQHILVSVPNSAAPAVDQERRRRAEGVLRQAAARRSGDGFAQLARQFSEDPGSKTRGGYLNATSRGRFVPAFDTVAWRLAPGTMSGLVRSSFGYHIIRRPPLEEVRDSFRAEVEGNLQVRFDSVYIDSLTKTAGLKIASGAPALVRQTIEQPVSATTDSRKLATYRGGALRVRDLARWLFAIDPRDVSGIGVASDGQLTEFVRRLAEREMLLAQVDSAGVQLTPDDWREIRLQHDSVLSILHGVLGLTPQLLRDSAATEPARVRLAMTHVNGYLDRVFRQQTAEFFPVPPFLALTLREGREWSINPAGVSRALEQAQAIRARIDSTAPAARPGLRPAPGPAPVPAGTATPRPQ